MLNYFKRNERTGFIVLFAVSLAVGLLGTYCWLTGWSNAAKLIGTSGLLATATGVVQLEVSGLFAKITEEYGNEEKYPYGPPSYITREIIYNPDQPFREWLRGQAFFSTATGFWLILVGTAVQILAVWV
jgi:hypothetical protein